MPEVFHEFSNKLFTSKIILVNFSKFVSISPIQEYFIFMVSVPFQQLFIISLNNFFVFNNIPSILERVFMNSIEFEVYPIFLNIFFLFSHKFSRNHWDFYTISPIPILKNIFLHFLTILKIFKSTSEVFL